MPPLLRQRFTSRVNGTLGEALTGAVALLRNASSSPQLDAEILLAHVLRKPRAFLTAHRRRTLDPKAARAFSSFVRRRAEGIPLPYLTGEQEFFGRPFAVTPAVLIPRPESETIVEEVLRLLGERDGTATRSAEERRPILADIGTGSGVLAVTIATEAHAVRVVATDASAAALAVARRNVRRHRVLSRLICLESDLLSEIPSELAPRVIVANLPYVPSTELRRAGSAPDTRGLAFEPQKALDGGPDGLFVIRRFFAQLKRSQLKDTLHHLVLEHSPNQRRRILERAHDTLPNFKPHEVSPFVTSWTKA